MLKEFNYKKDDGSITQRVVYVISPPSDLLKCIDLTEYSQEERDEFEAGLQQIHNEFLDGITELGLKYNWRSFKNKGILPLTED